MAAIIETKNLTNNNVQSLSKGNNKYLIIIRGTKGTITKEVSCKPHKLKEVKKELLNDYNKGINNTSELKYKEVFCNIN